jgi:hypothetical protein
MSYWATLHQDDRLLTITSIWCGSEAEHVTSLHLPQHLLKSDCRKMMAFINYYMAIVSDEILYLALPDKALEHGYINEARLLVLTPANLAYLCRIHLQETCQLSSPLL